MLYRFFGVRKEALHRIRFNLPTAMIEYGDLWQSILRNLIHSAQIIISLCEKCIQDDQISGKSVIDWTKKFY